MSLNFEAVIQALLNADNNRRTQAQNYLQSITSTQFDDSISAFLVAMNNSNSQIATMAALLLKKKYFQKKQNADKLTNQKLQFIVKSVQSLMQPQKSVMLLKRCCDIIVKAYNKVNQQKQLMSLIKQLSGNTNNNIKISLYYLIEIICQCSFNDQLLMQNSTSFELIFQNGLQDDNNQIKVAAFKTLTIFLSSIQDVKLMKKFESVLHVLINKAIQLIKYDQESGVVALQSLNELIEAHPKFIKTVINQLLAIFTEIMQTPSLLINLRTTSMYGVLMICINHPSSVRKNQYFSTKMAPAYMKMLSQINGTSQQQWAEQLNDQIISKNDISLSTEQHLGQILNQLTNKFMLPIFIPHIQTYLSSAQIQHQHAGLVSMAILTQNCHQSFKNNLKDIISLILPLLKTNNYRIKHDVLMALGYMSQQFSPQIQKQYGNIMLEFIISCLQAPALKVQYKAVQCLQNFQKGLQQHRQLNTQIMKNYLPKIMQQIARIFEFSVTTNNYILMQSVLDTITSLAQMNSFENYYPVFMPVLKKILSIIGCQNQQQIMIRSKTVETIGYLLASIKQHPHLFENDCKQIMQTMIKMSLSLQFDDAMHRAIFVVYENVVTSLKQNFSFYGEQIYPLVIQAANRVIQLTIIQQGDTSKAQNLNKTKNNYASYKLDMKVDGVKNLVLNTDNLAQKIQATNLIVQMAEDMKLGFSPFIQKTIPVVKSLISYKHNKQIRSNMIQTVKYMIYDCVNNQQKSFIVNQTYQCICDQLALTIKNKDVTQMSQIIQIFSQMIQFMNQDMINKMPSMLTAALTLIKNQTKQVQKQYAQKQMDQALQQQMGDQIAQIQQSLEYIQKIIKMSNGIPVFQQLKSLFPSDYQFGN